MYGEIKYAVFFSMLPLFLVASFRYAVGTDFLNYVYFYDLAKEDIWHFKEPVFNLTILLLLKMGLSSQWLFVVSAGLFCILTYISIFKKSPYPLLSIFLLVSMTHYFAFLNIMRQLLGAAVVLYGLRFIEEDNLKYYLTCVGIATGFHLSCILFFPMYWLCKIKLNRIKVIFLFCIVVLFLDSFSKAAISLLENSVYYHYFGSKYDTGNVGYVYILVQLVVDAFVLLQYQTTNKYIVYFNLQIINTWLAFLSGGIPLIGRLRYLFGLPCIILIPMALFNIKNNVVRLVCISLVVVTYAVYSYIVVTSGYFEVLPYRTIFDRL